MTDYPMLRDIVDLLTTQREREERESIPGPVVVVLLGNNLVIDVFSSQNKSILIITTLIFRLRLLRSGLFRL